MKLYEILLGVILAVTMVWLIVFGVALFSLLVDIALGPES